MKLEDLLNQREIAYKNMQRIQTLVELHSRGEGKVMSASELKCRLEILESYFQLAIDIQNKVEQLDSADDSRADIEDSFILTKTSIQALLGNGIHNSTIVDPSYLGHAPSSKLPKLKLPSFSGNYADFRNFITSFQQLIDSENSLSNIEKFNHLLNCLTGQALETVKAFQVTNENYPKAMSRLKSRYDNTTLIFLENISSLFELQSISKPNSSKLRSLVDNASALYDSLLSLGNETQITQAMLIYLVMDKVDAQTRKKWSESLDFKQLPTWENCAELLERHCQYLESLQSQNTNSNDAAHSEKSARNLNNRRQGSSFAAIKSNCLLCSSENHKINNCARFRSMDVANRFENIKRLNLCVNCLAKGHQVSDCPSKFSCRVCSQNHHTMLHRINKNGPSTSSSFATVTTETPSTPNNLPSTSGATVYTHMEMTSKERTLLATAIVHVQDASGGYKVGRVLLDSCSQVNFITDSFAQLLRLPRTKCNIEIKGIGNSNTNIKHCASTTIKSRTSEFKLPLSFCITSNIAYQPDSEIESSFWKVPANIDLADEKFFKARPVDMLLGADIFFDILAVGQIKLGPNLPTLQKTVLGWIVSGRYGSSSRSQPPSQSCLLGVEESYIDQQLQRFWNIEEIQPQPRLTNEQEICERIFDNTVSRDATGRVVVKLPFKDHPKCLGLSYSTAYRRFLAQERRYSRSPDLKSEYCSFMEEYEKLGHMSVVKSPNLDNDHYYIPHHCVLRPSSTSTKLRVVFDASCNTSSQRSLNDILLVGPVLQPELYILLLRFRLFKFALTADIIKMYRQVLVSPEDRKFQFILWRSSPNEIIQTYALNTVTYGTASAPYLAVKALNYLADQYASEFNVGSQVIKNCFYVDDLLCGTESLEELSRIKTEITEILRRGGLQLHKWHSNSAMFMDDSTPKNLNLDDNTIISALGVKWDQSKDAFLFSFDGKGATPTKISKRTVLSITSSLFDPLGIVGPIIITGKILLQEMWLLKLNWDESVPQHLHTAFTMFMKELASLESLSIPRYCLTPKIHSLQLHGFCDASLRAYGCCLYTRSIDTFGNIKIELLTAKSRVAPTRKLSLPKLELCGALTLARLYQKVKCIFAKYDCSLHCWTDSQIVLHWLKMHSATLSVFVGNRVSEIQELTANSEWRHVPTKLNPADIISRGCTVEDLRTSSWLNGPTFLASAQCDWPQNSTQRVNMAEVVKEQRKTTFTASVQSNHILESIERFSSHIKCLRIIAWMLRFKHVALKAISRHTYTFSLSPLELQNAFWCIVWNLQHKYFADDIQAINTNTPIKSNLKYLSPFLDNVGSYNLLRIGGRLDSSDISAGNIHQILLPSKSAFVLRFVRHLHRINYHAGPKALVALMRQEFWVVNARDLARRVVRSCVHCVRYRPKLLEQIMGNLPMERINPSRPFSKCGVDFCGPINTYLRIRGKGPYKTYIAVFVCFSTKAVHIEVVSDLSTEAFLASLRRMIGRRGLPSDIYCDNATNFVGASNRLAELKSFLFDAKNKAKIFDHCAQQFINFHFIPPRAPHFGGLWEAAVKAAKGHLNRSLMNTRLTFEELCTAVTEVEAILNSRPISPLSSDPNDLEALTPGHFLVGSALRALPERRLADTNITNKERWAQVTAITQRFWERWRSDYLNEMQMRTKWVNEQPNVTPGTMVIIHEDNLPPQKWILGRVVNALPGQDGLVRVVDIQTAKGIMRRPIRKIAILPA